MTSQNRDIQSLLRDIPIRILLVLAFLTAGLLPVMIGSLVSFEIGRRELKEQAFKRLEAVRSVKQAHVEKFFRERISDAETMAQSLELKKAFTEMSSVCPTETGKLRGYDRGSFDAPPDYREVHDRYAGYLSDYARKQGYYDLILLDNRGMACFSVEKEADFGRNHAHDSSALGDAFRAVNASGTPVLTDMKLYAPSKDAPAQFAAAPLVTDDGPAGVVVLQISIDSIDAVMGNREGMGQTGESYLTGSDYRLRSDSVLDPQYHGVVASFRGTPENNGVMTPATARALAGETGTATITGYRGTKVLSAFAPLKVGGSDWAIVVETEESEIDRQIDNALTGSLTAVLGASGAFVIVLAFLASALIARHLKYTSMHFQDITGQILQGKLNAMGDPEKVGPDFRALVQRTNELISAFNSRLDDLPVPVMMLDTRSRIVFVNSAAAALSGRPPEGIVGQACCAVFGTAGARCTGAETIDGCPAASAMSKNHPVHGEACLTCAKGLVPVSFTSSPVRHPDGSLVGAWMVFIDQSFARSMTAEKRRLETQLFRAQRLDALGTLSSGIAHDFNNILSCILVYADLLAGEIDSDGPARQNLDQITTAVERAAEIVRQMLVFSRQMDGRRILFPAAPVISDTVGLIRPGLAKNTRINTDIRNTEVRLDGDPTHLSQVVMNLCSNARDALGSDGGTIGVSMSVDDTRDEMVLTVTDDGCGMDSQTRERIFDPFFTTKAPGSGSGLGLAVVHGIVTTWGGTISVGSDPGKGTTMTVRIPVSRHRTQST